MIDHLYRFITRIASPEQSLPVEAQRYWSNSQSDDLLREHSHWIGYGRWADEDAWMGIGRKSRRLLESLGSLTETAGTMKSVMEWGQGGGANAVHFIDQAETYYGVDLSEANLQECGRQLSTRGFKGFESILIDPEHPEAVLETVDRPLDVFLSTAVFQHFPSREYGIRILRIASKLLAPGGRALIQIRFDNGDDRYQTKSKDYRRHALTFTSYRIDEFWNEIENEGLSPHSIMLKNDTNYATFLITKPGPDSQVDR